MKKIILIACLLAWQNLAAAPVKPAANTGKPAASANKKTAVKPVKTKAADKNKEKSKDKGKAKPAAKTAKQHAAKTDKTAHKTKTPAAKTDDKKIAKNSKLADKKNHAKALVKTLPKKDTPSKPEATLQGGTTKTRQNVLANGKKYIGTPYLWGGSTPKGFDCSGLIHYLYGKQGVSIPRNSREQFSRLQATSEPQPGDLVFFRKKGVINHVGLYLGDGQMLHAPQTGMRVRVENIKRGKWPGRYAGARKAVKDKTVIVLAASDSGKAKKTAAHGKLVARNTKTARKTADNKAKSAQSKATTLNNKRLVKESKTIRSKGRVISAR